jgi:hypothetical protein
MPVARWFVSMYVFVLVEDDFEVPAECVGAIRQSVFRLGT